MSVTFSIETTETDISGHRLFCYGELYGRPGEGHGPARDFNTFAEVQAAYEMGLADGTVERHCCSTTPVIDVDSSLDVNLANANAAEVLDVLGLVPEDREVPWFGSVDPVDLEGRILVALALASDCEVPGYESQETGSARIVVQTREAGYLSSKLRMLSELASAAQKLGRQVSWS